MARRRRRIAPVRTSRPMLCAELPGGAIILVPFDQARIVEWPNQQASASVKETPALEPGPTAEAIADRAEAGAFVAGECVVQTGARVRSGVLHAAYSAWAHGQGREAMGFKRFKRALRAQGFWQRHSDGMWWFGLMLRDALAVGRNAQISGLDGLFPFPAVTAPCGSNSHE